MKRKQLVGLEPSQYEHDFDREALNALKKLKGFDTVMKFFLDWAYVKWNIIAYQGSNFQITMDSCPELYRLMKEAQKILDVDLLPQLYTKWDYSINGFTTGWKDSTLMVLNSGTVDLLEDDELLYVVGHEFGHIKSGHVVYHMMANMFGSFVSQIPGMELLSGPIYYALMYWSRMSEFTADRAGLLTTQNIDACITAIMKGSGVPLHHHGKMMKESFLKQARDFSESFKGVGSSLMKTAMIAGSTHPWGVMRASELLKWYESGEYEKVLNHAASVATQCPRCKKTLKKDTKVCPYCGTTL